LKEPEVAGPYYLWGGAALSRPDSRKKKNPDILEKKSING